MLKKNQRLKRNEFEILLKKGKRIHNKHFVLTYINANETKCGVVVSKKISKKATDRNLIRRRVYSILGENMVLIENKHVSVSVKKSVLDIKYTNLEKSIIEELSKI